MKNETPTPALRCDFPARAERKQGEPTFGFDAAAIRCTTDGGPAGKTHHFGDAAKYAGMYLGLAGGAPKREARRPNSCRSARVISVIETVSVRGSGLSDSDPCREVTEYWGTTPNAITHLAEMDPFVRDQSPSNWISNDDLLAITRLRLLFGSHRSLVELTDDAVNTLSLRESLIEGLQSEIAKLKAEIAGWNSVQSSKALRRRHGKKRPA